VESAGLSSEAYLDAFMSGFEFVLLAMRGRLAEPGLDDAERARIESFLEDYWRISASYHARHPERPAAPAVVHAFPVDLPPQAVN
jgi:hypothetical protein